MTSKSPSRPEPSAAEAFDTNVVVRLLVLDDEDQELLVLVRSRLEGDGPRARAELDALVRAHDGDLPRSLIAFVRLHG